MTVRPAWTCARCRAQNLWESQACRRCGAARARRLTSRAASAGFAALLSGLLPGLGQLYQERWVRGLLMILLPAFALALVGAFVFVADPLTALVVRYASLATLLVVGGLFAFHLVSVADAFAGSAAVRRARDYAALAVVTLALAGAYGAIYAQSSAWATLLTRVFEPVTRALPVSAAEPAAPQWGGSERLNVLLLGLDRRGTDGETQNTDTLIVLSLDPLNRTAAMLSIPRDTYVAIPGHGSDKINAAYSYGGTSRGPDLARRAVEGLLGVPIHSYALIDFEAFTEIVDGVGGVLVDVRRPLRDEEYPSASFGVQRIHFTAGPQLLDGAAALRYARSRHDSNDFSRARRQQDVLAALRTRLASGGIGRLPGLVDRVGSAVETNFDPGNVLPLARTGFGIEREDIRSEVLLPCGGDEEHCELTEQNGADGYYLIPDRAKIADLVAQVLYDPRVKVESARIELQLTGAADGLTDDAAERLTARAFAVVREMTGSNSRSAVVLRETSKRYTAERLAAQLGGLPVVSERTGAVDADIVVRLGSDFRGFATDLEAK